MSRPLPRFRFVTVVLAALQLLLPGLASLADARAEREGRSPGATAHLEPVGGEHCPAIHADDCALCQFLTAARDRAPRGPAVAVASLDGVAPSPAVARAPGAVTPGALLPRAPPTT